MSWLAVTYHHPIKINIDWEGAEELVVTYHHPINT